LKKQIFMKRSNFLKTAIGLTKCMKYIFTISFSILFMSYSIAQSNSIFGYINQGNSSTLQLNHLVEGDNNHFYVIGYDNSTQESFLIKSDQNGSIAWQKKLILNDPTSTQSPAQLCYHNNYLYVLMVCQSYGIFDSTILDSSGTNVNVNMSYQLAMIDISGNLVWAKNIELIDPYLYHQPSIDFGPADEIIVASSSFSRVELFSFNDDGSTNWIRNCSSDSTESKNPNFDIATCDNGDIMGCSKAGNDMCFYRLSSTGVPIWSKTIIEGSNYTHIKSIRQISSNIFIACGYRTMGGPTRGFYTLIDGSGNFISFTLVNELLLLRNIFRLDNGNFLMIGLTSADNEFAFIEINSSGTILNSYKTISAPFYQEAYEGVIDMNGYLYVGDGNYIQKLDDMTGVDCLSYVSTISSLTGDDPSAHPMLDYFALHSPTGTVNNNTTAHLDPSNIVHAAGCGLNMDIEPTPESNIQVYPTLLTNAESMFIDHEITGEVKYQMMDMNGKMIQQNILSNSSIVINGMSAGVYVLLLTSNGNVVYHSKFVVN
jgi:hypothetical protein